MFPRFGATRIYSNFGALGAVPGAEGATIPDSPKQGNGQSVLIHQLHTKDPLTESGREFHPTNMTYLRLQLLIPSREIVRVCIRGKGSHFLHHAQLHRSISPRHQKRQEKGKGESERGDKK